MSIQSFIQATVQENGFELVLAPNEKPRWRKEKSWQFFSDKKLDQVLTQFQIRAWVLSLLPELQREQVLQGRSVSGFWDKNEQKFFYEVVQTQSGEILSLQWIPAEWREPSFWQFPNWLLQSVSQKAGLGILVSPQTPVRDAGIEAILKGIEEKNLWSVWLKKEGLVHAGLSNSLLTYSETIPAACDLVIIEGEDQIETAIRQAESGKMVIWSVSHFSLRHVFENLAVSNNRDRWLQQFKWALNLRTIIGSTEWLPAYDLLLGTASVQDKLRTLDFSSLEELIENSEKSSGMRTINQSLMQHLVRRRLDFKKSFEVSPEPERLDQLLKAIGV